MEPREWEIIIPGTNTIIYLKRAFSSHRLQNVTKFDIVKMVTLLIQIFLFTAESNHDHEPFSEEVEKFNLLEK